MNKRIAAEEVLLLLSYAVDLLAMPTFRKWNQSYEGWLYQNGLLNRLHYLESRKCLERNARNGSWAFQVTRAGRRIAWGGRDPEVRWSRRWDGWWREFVFDLPCSHHKARSTLVRWLRNHGFGYLQDSVWISPDPSGDIARSLRPFQEDAGSFTLFECRCARGFSNAALVAAAWPLGEIRERYAAYQRFASDAIRRLRHRRFHPRDLFLLMREERTRWSAAFELDPLLPKALWPRDYEGHRAWRTRKDLLCLAAGQMTGP